MKDQCAQQITLNLLIDHRLVDRAITSGFFQRITEFIAYFRF